MVDNVKFILVLAKGSVTGHTREFHRPMKVSFNGTREVPQSFGNYIQVHKLGMGATCVVLLCRHKKTNAEFACKCVNREHLHSADLFVRFEQEVRILQSLKHTNIVQVKDLIFDEHFIYLILEYCPNGELFNFISVNGLLEIDFARRLFIQIVDAISFIHERGIAHRDIKPENILLDSDFNIKLTDFGLCHGLADRQLLNTPVGSPLYAPPEVIMGHRYNGFQSDIWSLGVVLFAMVTGTLPWKGERSPALFEQIRKGEFTIPQDLEPSLRALIMSMLCLNPHQRITLAEIKRCPWISRETSLRDGALHDGPAKAARRSANDASCAKCLGYLIGNRQSVIVRPTRPGSRLSRNYLVRRLPSFGH